jgi:hypothetical protein
MNLPVGKKNKGEWVVKAVGALDKGCPKDLADFIQEIFTYLQRVHEDSSDSALRV